MSKLTEDEENVLENLHALSGTEDGQKFINILGVISELMLQTANKNLKGATLIREFRHERITITVRMEKHK
jgi:hypothetical protein